MTGTFPNQPPPPGSSWLVSFGDLLTLLLCFFIALIVLTREATPPASAAEPVTPSQLSRIEVPGAVAALPRPPGTTLAANLEEQSRFELLFEEGDFEADGTALSSAARERIENAFAFAAYTPKPVRIVACGGGRGESTDAGWLESMQRLLELRSQLLDAGADMGRAELEPAGPYCNRIGGQQEQPPRALIVLEFMEELSHG